MAEKAKYSSRIESSRDNCLCFPINETREWGDDNKKMGKTLEESLGLAVKVQVAGALWPTSTNQLD